MPNYGRAYGSTHSRIKLEGKIGGEAGIEAGCYIELSPDHEWDNAVNALLLAVDCLNFAEDCDGLSNFDKNQCKRYANLIYDLIDRIEGSYRPDQNVLPPRVCAMIQGLL